MISGNFLAARLVSNQRSRLLEAETRLVCSPSQSGARARYLLWAVAWWHADDRKCVCTCVCMPMPGLVVVVLFRIETVLFLNLNLSLDMF